MSDALKQLLDPTEPPDDMFFVSKVAACAILMELAAADGETALVEQQAITRAMADKFGIHGPSASMVQAIATHSRTPDGNTDSYARFIREMWSPSDRRTVLEAVREVIWADGVLDANEEKLVWRLAATLGMPFDEVRGVLLVGPADS